MVNQDIPEERVVDDYYGHWEIFNMWQTYGNNRVLNFSEILIHMHLWKKDSFKWIAWLFSWLNINETCPYLILSIYMR